MKVEKKTSNTAGWVKIPEANLRAIEAENIALKRIAKYFSEMVQPPDMHEIDDNCEQCKMHRELKKILDGE